MRAIGKTIGKGLKWGIVELAIPITLNLQGMLCSCMYFNFYLTKVKVFYAQFVLKLMLAQNGNVMNGLSLNFSQFWI